ncbi:hypothetical protein BC332_15195 [Capsicum chinense]|nr:hypothetical protein BC332_15195 [Capsicum chinense]
MIAQLPKNDETSISYKQMLAQLDLAMGERVVEELIFGKSEITSGPSDDLKQVTKFTITWSQSLSSAMSSSALSASLASSSSSASSSTSPTSGYSSSSDSISESHNCHSSLIGTSSLTGSTNSDLILSNVLA